MAQESVRQKDGRRKICISCATVDFTSMKVLFIEHFGIFCWLTTETRSSSFAGNWRKISEDPPNRMMNSHKVGLELENSSESEIEFVKQHQDLPELDQTVWIPKLGFPTKSPAVSWRSFRRSR